MYHIKEKVISELEVKKSRFFGVLMPLDDERTIKDEINNLKKVYPSATHYCYGAIINGNYRSNDDGEPSSTAGKPILEALKNNQLDNVLCVVVRYFGGTLLGTSGLIKAYGQACSQAIASAILTTPITINSYRLEIDYEFTNRIEHLLQQKAQDITREYQDKTIYYFKALNDLNNEIQQLTNGKASAQFVKEEIVEMPIK